MNGFKWIGWGFLGGLAMWLLAPPTGAWAQGSAEGRPSTDAHVPELARYLDDVQISEPVAYRGLAVYPILLRANEPLRGRWLTLEDAISRGVLVIREKGSGSVPVVVAENTSRDEHVFIMAGEVISGGKQTRTVRDEVVLAPGQRIDLEVFCVEAHRWEGEEKFSGGGGLVPQSIQRAMRGGAGQSQVWDEVARNNAGLGAENATGSLDAAMKSKSVQDRLADVRRAIAPKLPDGTLGFIFVDRGRAMGAELFGRGDLARGALPKLLDSYAVDHILLRKAGEDEGIRRDSDEVAIDFFKRVARAGSRRTDTPGSGAGIRTRGGGLLGDGVSLGGELVHYGVQIQDRIVPTPEPRPSGTR